jgi:hypothetical protein
MLKAIGYIIYVVNDDRKDNPEDLQTEDDGNSSAGAVCGLGRN